MAIKLDLLADASVAALTKPGQDNKRKRLIVELSKFKDKPAIEGIQFRYSFSQGKGLYYTASYSDCHHILDMMRNALRSKEPVVESLPHSAKNRPDVVVECGRNQNLEPFIRIRGSASDGQPLSKDFYFALSRNKSTILRNGQPIPDLELQERCASIWTKSFSVYLRALEENYERSVFEPYGQRQGGNGGYNQGGYSQGGYKPQGQPSNGAPATNANYDDILD